MISGIIPKVQFKEHLFLLLFSKVPAGRMLSTDKTTVWMSYYFPTSCLSAKDEDIIDAVKFEDMEIKEQEEKQSEKDGDVEKSDTNAKTCPHKEQDQVTKALGQNLVDQAEEVFAGANEIVDEAVDEVTQVIEHQSFWIAHGVQIFVIIVIVISIGSLWCWYRQFATKYSKLNALVQKISKFIDILKNRDRQIVNESNH